MKKNMKRIAIRAEKIRYPLSPLRHKELYGERAEKVRYHKQSIIYEKKMASNPEKAEKSR